MSLPPIEPQRSLSAEDIRSAVAALVDEQLPTAAKAAFLTALARRGETPEEIAGFALELRDRATAVPLDPVWRSRQEILDVCGTGGDRLHTFNISTTVAIVCAAAGILVAKHGNRAVTSGSGSADVLEALGIRVDLSPAEAAQALATRGFAFLFAPHYHPAFKHIAPARKLCAEQGQRTIFNFLGPLLNPARPTAQLVGVPQPALCEPMARALQTLGVRRAMVVCGTVPPEDGGAVRHMDEVSTLGPNTVAEFHHERGLNVAEWSVTDFPLQPARLADLTGGDRHANAAIIVALLSGEDRGPKRDAVLLGSGTALFVAGRVRTVAEGWDLAAKLIDSGQAKEKLRELRA